MLCTKSGPDNYLILLRSPRVSVFSALSPLTTYTQRRDHRDTQRSRRRLQIWKAAIQATFVQSPAESIACRATPTRTFRFRSPNHDCPMRDGIAGASNLSHAKTCNAVFRNVSKLTHVNHAPRYFMRLRRRLYALAADFFCARSCSIH